MTPPIEPTEKNSGTNSFGQTHDVKLSLAWRGCDYLVDETKRGNV